MEAKIKIGTFLAESCGRALDPPPPTAPTTQKYHFFDAAPKANRKDCVLMISWFMYDILQLLQPDLARFMVMFRATYAMQCHGLLFLYIYMKLDASFLIDLVTCLDTAAVIKKICCFITIFLHSQEFCFSVRHYFLLYTLYVSE